MEGIEKAAQILSDLLPIFILFSLVVAVVLALYNIHREKQSIDDEDEAETIETGIDEVNIIKGALKKRPKHIIYRG